MVITRSKKKQEQEEKKEVQLQQEQKKQKPRVLFIDDSSDSDTESDEDYEPPTTPESLDDDIIEDELDEEIPVELAEKIKNNQIKRRIQQFLREDQLAYLKEDKSITDILDNNNLTDKEKTELVKVQKNINNLNNLVVPDKIKVLQSSMSLNMKALLIGKIDKLAGMDPMHGEYHKLQNWVDGFMRVPFGKYIDMPITIKDDVGQFLCNTNKILDDAIYGHTSAKNEIIQLVAQWISNPTSKGSVIGLKGPPGTGKTTLVKYGIAKALKRPFSFIPLGGATDSAFLEGHSYTYEGSTWGRMVEVLIESQCMNPVIFMDELDKVSETKNGQEISGKLIHLTDFQQNNEITDKYFSGIKFDLSRALFIFSYNDETKINPILKDRIKIIEINGFSDEDKVHIAKDYLLPSIYKEIGFTKDDIQISDDVIKYIIMNTDDEKGVRRLKENLTNLVSKLNVSKYLTKEQATDLNMTYISNFSLPFTLTTEHVDKLSMKQNKSQDILSLMYI